MEKQTEFDNIFRLYYARLYYFALRQTGNPPESEDIVHNAFEYYWRHFEHIEKTTVKSFLYIFVRNKCIDYFRQKNLHEKYIAYYSELTEPVLKPDELEVLEGRVEQLHIVLKNMRQPTRQILEHCYINGYKYSEVAEDMGISIHTVKKHIVKALKIMRDSIPK